MNLTPYVGCADENKMPAFIDKNEHHVRSLANMLELSYEREILGIHPWISEGFSWSLEQLLLNEGQNNFEKQNTIPYDFIVNIFFSSYFIKNFKSPETIAGY